VNAHGGFLGILRGLFDDAVLPYLDHATSKLISHVPIEAVGVWDTVGSMGIPLYDHGAVLDYFKFTNQRLPAAVRTGIHAVAIDEERETFTPTLWEDDVRVTQVLFAGAHSDVGGGYNECQLSDISYQWMANRLAALDLLFAQEPTYNPGPDFRGQSHRPWTHAPWSALGVNPRTFPANIRVSKSVCDRVSAGPVPSEGVTLDACYGPGNKDCFDKGFPPEDHLIEP
jgi:hypothetical protein